MASKTATKFYLSRRFHMSEDALAVVVALATAQIVANIENVDEYGWRSLWVRTDADRKLANVFIAGYFAGKAAA